jgi:hypothetical protein
MQGLGALIAGLAGGFAARRKKRAADELECVVEAIREMGDRISTAVKDEGSSTRKVLHEQGGDFSRTLGALAAEVAVLKDRTPRRDV